jgi:hypothetical protein
MPLTPLRTPLKPPHANNSNVKARVALNKATLAKNAISYILTLNDISLITIRYK